MEKDKDFFDFWLMLWKGKIIIIIVSIIFFLIGFLVDKSTNLKPSFKANIKIDALSIPSAASLARINDYFISSTYQKFFLFERILNSNLELSTFDIDVEKSNYLKDIINPNSLIDEFYSQITTNEHRLSVINEIKYIDINEMSNSEYDKAVLEFASVDDLVVQKQHVLYGNEVFGKVISINKGYKLVNNEQKLKEYIFQLIESANKKVNLQLKIIIEKSIQNLETEIILEKENIKKEIEIFSEILLGNNSEKIIKIKEQMIDDDFDEIIKEIQKSYKKIYLEGKNNNLNPRQLDQLIQKIIYIDSGNRDILLKKIQHEYELSGIKDLKFKAVSYEPNSIMINKKKLYKPNYMLVSLVAGLIFSVMFLVLKDAYQERRSRNI